MIRACPELGFAYDTYFTDEIVIEKKNSLSELAGNLASVSDDGERIFKEFNRMINVERAYLVIENDGIDGIFEHKVSIGIQSRFLHPDADNVAGKE